VRGLLAANGLLATSEFREALMKEATERGLHMHSKLIYKPHFDLKITAADPAFDRGGDGLHCRGCLWWLRHYAFLGEKLAQGPLSLKGIAYTSLISNANELEDEIRHQQRLPNADFVTVAAQHGSIWHVVASMHVGISSLRRYPTRTAEEMCGDAF
jgi:hypothetical protein